MDAFEQFLNRRGKTLTEPRMAVFRAAMRIRRRFDAGRLWSQVNRERTERKLSRPTVYRILVELVESGIVQRSELKGRSVLCRTDQADGM